MSGNGKKVDYPGIPTAMFKKPYDIIPADNGGGCVESGPFAKYVLSSLSSLPPKLQSIDHTDKFSTA